MTALHFLYVDDEPHMRQLVAEAFAESSIRSHVHGVGTAREARAFLVRDGDHADAPRPDLVLLDRDLAEASGLDVLPDLRAHPTLTSVPVVMFTNYDDDSHVATAYERGANAFVQKPPDFEDLVSFADGAATFWGSAPTAGASA